MDDQPALGPDGRLRNASEIEWYNDPDDTHPIQTASHMQGSSFFLYIASADSAESTKLLIVYIFRSTLTSSPGDHRLTTRGSHCRGET
jgi:hypothetical protein